jgi:hypothetical protein
MRKSLALVFTLIAVVLPMQTHADTFEFLTFKPPTGWTKQTATDGVVYRRPNGIGLISVYTSQPASGTAEQEFAKMWGEKIEPAMSIKAPAPVVETDSDYRVAVGGQTVDVQGTATGISLMTFVRKGRVIGLSTVFGGEAVQREIAAFLLSIKLEGSIGPTGGSSGAADTIDVDFDVPSGYLSQRDGSMIVLKPTTMDRNTPCIYGISQSRASKGNLEADARAALLEPLPGWQIKSEHYNAMRGTAGDGWPYFWLRTDVQQMSGGSMQYLTAMSMAFPNGAGRVSIVWGFGSTGPCDVNDATFSRLFHSLRPRGWKPDGGKAFAKELVGTWRNTESSGMAQYIFSSNGRYEYGQGTSTTFGNLETRTGSVGDGSFSLRGSELTLTGGRRAGKYLVRIYDEYSAGIWLKTMSVLNSASNPPLEVRYMRVAQ